MAIAKRRGWVFVLAIIGGLVLGSLLGKLCEGSPYLWWLGYAVDFGFRMPETVTLDIYLMTLTFSCGVWFRFNVASILGMLVAWLIFRKW